MYGEAAQLPDDPRQVPKPTDTEQDQKLPNGKSQKDAIARENHQKALRDAEELVRLSTQLQEDLKKSGEYIVPLSSVKRTEEIEKLARRIRNRLKG
jgi:hypothetical protein